MVKISDVAKLAGVSPATVSRVINGTAKVDEGKRKRVLEAISETGFKPNEIARSLFRKSSKIIGYIIPNIENMYLSEIGRAIEMEAFKNGYKMVLCNSEGKPEKEIEYINMLESMNADGIIITTNNDDINNKIKNCRIPVVGLDKKPMDIYDATIQGNNYLGGRLATEHLIKCGCKKIVQMKGPDRYSSAIERFQGYIDVCKENNINPLFIESHYDFSDGLENAKELLRKFPDVDGILAASDMVAFSVYKVLYEMGKHVPEDVKIIGFDGIYLGNLMTPSLTTIAQPISEQGRLAARIIIDIVEKGEEPIKENIFPVSLKIRQTTVR